VAFGAAPLTSKIRKMVLYEGWPVPNPEVYALPPGLEDRLEALLATGDRDAVVETIFRELELLSDQDMKAFKAAPSWPDASPPRTPSPARSAPRPGPGWIPSWRGRIAVPVLLLTGETSSDPSKADIEAVVAAALPDARIVVLQGREHVADVLVPAVFAEQVLAFLRDQH
jgi:pimeloyl-ACP methyl ester carboxylesterase